MNLEYKFIFKNIAGFAALAIFFLLTSCNEDISQNKHEKRTDFPSQEIYDAEVIQRDSGRVVLKLKAPVAEKYEFVDTAYAVAPKGIYIEFYDKEHPENPGKLWANYAKMIEKTQFYTARGDVKIINPEGQTFKMQSIFWDKGNKRMYTHDTVYITDKDGNVLIGANGMNARDDFSEYSLYSSYGEANPDKLPDMKLREE